MTKDPNAQRAFDALKKANAILATVESCTGGSVATRITNLAGSSEIFWTSWVTYANEAKEALGVSGELLAQHGAVSEQVARAMAEAGLASLERQRSRSTQAEVAAKTLVCVSTTGVAGPSGGTERKPVGLCWVGIAVSGSGGRRVEAWKFQSAAGSDREANRAVFADEAFQRLIAALQR